MNECEVQASSIGRRQKRKGSDMKPSLSSPCLEIRCDYDLRNFDQNRRTKECLDVGQSPHLLVRDIDDDGNQDSRKQAGHDTNARDCRLHRLSWREGKIRRIFNDELRALLLSLQTFGQLSLR